jgi:hypothetical protein
MDRFAEQSIILAVLNILTGFWVAFHAGYSRHAGKGKRSPLSQIVTVLVPTTAMAVSLTATPLSADLFAPWPNSFFVFAAVMVIGAGIEVLLHALVLATAKSNRQEIFEFVSKVFGLLTLIIPVVMFVCEGVIVFGYLDPALQAEFKLGLSALYLLTTALVVQWYILEL